MKVLIHALGADMGGAIRHLSNFLPALAKYDAKNQYDVLVRTSTPNVTLAGNVRLVRKDGWQSIPGRIVFDNVLLGRLAKQEKYDMLVSLLNFGPLHPNLPHVIFQRNSLYYCDHFLRQAKGKAKWANLLRRRLAIASMRSATMIVTPTRAMAEMIKTSCPGIAAKRFTTLYHGFGHASLGAPLGNEFAKHLNRPGVKLLYPTHAASHKGFDVLFDIAASLKGDGLDFAIYATVCREDWPAGFVEFEKKIKGLGIEENVVFMGRVPQAQMGELYRSCDLMIYPSLCESFGFSMIEAMGHGLPIVAAGTAVNREMCREAALYYEPLDAAAGARAVRDALKPGVMAGLKTACRERIDSFDWSWERYAREFVALVESVAGQSDSMRESD